MPLLWQALGFAQLALVAAWNSKATQEDFYTFQEFYTDAQYGPDFGYYSTGRILHGGASQEDPTGAAYFNSYTTQPMSLSPFFGQLLCDRVVSMWISMGRPAPFFLMEFGGGTGMLARDILRHARNAHEEFFAAARYVIGERSPALQAAQRQTAAEFVPSKLLVVDADARSASKVRQHLEVAVVRGVVLSNELLDEFDPVRLRLSWAGASPDQERCKQCAAFREAHVLHRIDERALAQLLRRSEEAQVLGEAIRWEAKSLPCGLLDTQLLQRQVVERLSAALSTEELRRCSPMQLCCAALLLAVDGLMQDDHSSLQLGKLAASDQLLRRYRQQVARTNGTLLLSKHRYRQLRRLALQEGLGFEQELLMGSFGRFYSDEVYFALSPSRCRELGPWRNRHAARLAAAAKLRGATAPVYDRRNLGSTLQLKILVQPGHAEFVQEASALVDEGFMISMDYGADADALLWQALVHPNHEGIHIMDAREATSQCSSSYLACPGLQDITMTVDFTEAAEAGEAAGWRTAAYAPIFQLELAQDEHLPPLASLLERAGGPRSVGLHAWYRHSGADAWASFKVLVQYRGVKRWSLGSSSLSWPLRKVPALAEAPDECWSNDLSKPALAALVARSVDLGSSFQKLLEDLRAMQEAAELQYAWQRQAYRDLHLAQLLADYWLYFARAGPRESCLAPSADLRAAWLQQVRSVAVARRLPEMHGEVMFNRVFSALAGNHTPPAEPYECLVSQMIASFC